MSKKPFKKQSQKDRKTSTKTTNQNNLEQLLNKYPILDRELIIKLFNENGSNANATDKKIKAKIKIETNLNTLIDKFSEKFDITVITLLYEESDYNFQQTESKLDLMLKQQQQDIDNLQKNVNNLKIEERNQVDEEEGDQEIMDNEIVESNFSDEEEDLDEDEEGEEDYEKISENFVQFTKSLFPQYDSDLIQQLYNEHNQDNERLINELLSYDETTETDTKKEKKRKEEETDIEKLANMFPNIPPNLLPIILKENKNDVNKSVEYILSINDIYKNSQVKKGDNGSSSSWGTSKTLWSNFSSKLTQTSYTEGDQENESREKTVLLKENPNSLSTRLKFNVLNEKYGDCVPFEVLESVFVYSNYNLGASMEHIKSMYPWLNRTSTPKATPTNQYIPINPKTEKNKQQNKRKQKFNEVKKPQRNPTSKAPRNEGDSFDFNKDYNYYFGRAKYHAVERRKFFILANKQFANKDFANASVSMQKGKKHDNLMNKANQIASDLLNNVKNPNLGLEENIGSGEEHKYTVDLHGYFLNDAKKVYEEVLEIQKSKPPSSIPRKFLFVTGVGNHSKNGVPRIQLALIEHLKKNNYNFTEPHPGCIQVKFK